jgi:hypothetical protein
MHLTSIQVGRWLEHLLPAEPVGSAEHLRALEDHLDDVLVAVIPRGEDRVLVQDEDIHRSSPFMLVL